MGQHGEGCPSTFPMWRSSRRVVAGTFFSRVSRFNLADRNLPSDNLWAADSTLCARYQRYLQVHGWYLQRSVVSLSSRGEASRAGKGTNEMLLIALNRAGFSQCRQAWTAPCNGGNCAASRVVIRVVGRWARERDMLNDAARPRHGFSPFELL